MAVIDARTLPNATEIEADLIIIGGGLAGIAIAKQWAGSGKRVAVLESGGLEADNDTQDLYRGAGALSAPDNASRDTSDYLHQSRFRRLGGSGNVWGGKCVPLDESDFAERSWLPLSGWPLTRAQMNPYYDRACALFEIAPFNRDWDRTPEPDRPPLIIDDARDFFSAPRCFTRFSGFADREAFDRFRSDYAEAPNISVYLFANVTEIRRRGRQVRGLTVACLDGKRHSARARAYVLATGGIENARLMLANEIGGDWVGRCFQGHVNFGIYNAPEGRNSSLCISEPGRNMSLYTRADRDVTQCVLTSTLEGQRRYRIPNFTVTLFEESEPLAPDVVSITQLAAKLDRGADAASARNLACYFKTEQTPNPESRILLDAGSSDALGMPRVRLDWRFTALDLDLLERSVMALAQSLGGAGLGRVCWPADRSAIVALMTPARHHMGTTRFGADIEHGVVDENCRVHGLRNLYVAGSSVFPTSGNANPTLTLIALAMRLSDHLKREMGVRV
jgi:choline dehydrogenase-like flavoprotein